MHPICRCKRQKCQTLTQAFSFFFFFLQVDVCLLLANSMYRYSFPSSNQKKYVFFYNIVAKLRLSQFSEVCALFFAFSNIANANASVEHLPTSSSTVIQPFYKREREKEKKKSKDLFCGVTACYFFFHGRAGLRSKRWPVGGTRWFRTFAGVFARMYGTVFLCRHFVFHML